MDRSPPPMKQAEQNVLSSDVVDAESFAFGQGPLKRSLSAGSERNLAPRCLLLLGIEVPQKGANLVEGCPKRFESSGSHSLFLTDYAEQQMTVINEVVVQLSRLFLGENDDLPGPLGKSLKDLKPPLPAD